MSDAAAGTSRQFVARIDFTPGGNSRDYVLSGWYDPEPDGTWTSGHEARLRFPALPQRAAYVCEMVLRPLVDVTVAPAQELTIGLGTCEVARGALREGGRISFAIPAEAAEPRPDLVLVLKLPNAVSPHALGKGPDVRQLAFCVRELVIGAVEAVVAPAPKVAAVTMVYNEPLFLPLWLRHYGHHVGAQNCFVVDHGSEDGSTGDLGQANRLRIPRSAYDSVLQSEWNSAFCFSLLKWYDYVIYADADELLAPDPAIAATLAEYCRLPLPEVLTAIGLNLLHVIPSEPPLDFARPIIAQRRYAFFASSACKPLLIRRPVVWPGGSHSANAPVVFHHLYNFHLRWFDLPSGLRRLQVTRAMTWAREGVGYQSRMGDAEFIAGHQGLANLLRRDDMELGPDREPLRSWLERVLLSQSGREHDAYRIDLGIWPDSLWRLPERFVGLF